MSLISRSATPTTPFGGFGLRSLSELTCWTNTELSSSVFGPKQNLDYWESVFKTGLSSTGAVILPRGLVLQEMIGN